MTLFLLNFMPSSTYSNTWHFCRSCHQFIFMVVELSDQTLGSGCKTGWVRRPGSTSCYWFVVFPEVDWETADEACRNMSATLANLESEEEIIWMHGYKSYHQQLRINTWIGGRKFEGKWWWETSSGKQPMKITDWATTQPDNFGGNQDCLLTFGDHVSSESFFRFDDTQCANVNSYVCEMFI